MASSSKTSLSKPMFYAAYEYSSGNIQEYEVH